MRKEKNVRCGLIIRVCASALIGIAAAASAASQAVDAEEVHRLLGLHRKTGTLINACGNPVNPQIDIIDLNGDGKVEVFALVNDAVCYGAAGGQLSLFVRDSSGGWKDHFGFTAGGYRLLTRRRSGYPDIEIIGPGGCAPIWGWSAKGYVIVRRCAQ